MLLNEIKRQFSISQLEVTVIDYLINSSFIGEKRYRTFKLYRGHYV